MKRNNVGLFALLALLVGAEQGEARPSGCDSFIGKGERVYMLDWDDKSVGYVVDCTRWRGKYEIRVPDDDTTYYYPVEMLAKASGCTGTPRACVGDRAEIDGEEIRVVGVIVGNQVLIEYESGELEVWDAGDIRPETPNPRPNPPPRPQPPRPQPTPMPEPEPEPIPQPQPPAPNPQPSDPFPRPNPNGTKAYACKIETDGKIFEGEGANREEAAQAALNACYESSYSCQSSDVACMKR